MQGKGAVLQGHAAKGEREEVSTQQLDQFQKQFPREYKTILISFQRKASQVASFDRKKGMAPSDVYKLVQPNLQGAYSIHSLTLTLTLSDSSEALRCIDGTDAYTYAACSSSLCHGSQSLQWGVTCVCVWAGVQLDGAVKSALQKEAQQSLRKYGDGAGFLTENEFVMWWFKEVWPTVLEQEKQVIHAYDCMSDEWHSSTRLSV